MASGGVNVAGSAQVVPDVLRQWVDEWMELFILNDHHLDVSQDAYHGITQDGSTDTSSTPLLPWRFFKVDDLQNPCFFTVEDIAHVIMKLKRRRGPPAPPTMEDSQSAARAFNLEANSKQPQTKRARTSNKGCSSGSAGQEGADDQEQAKEKYHGVLWHNRNHKHEVQMLAPSDSRDPNTTWRQVYLTSFHDAFMAAKFWDLVQIKLYLCGFRLPGRNRVQLNFTEPQMLQEYLLRLQQPEWVGLTDWREVIQYVKREAHPERSIVPHHPCGALPQGVYIRGRCKTTADIPDRQSPRTKYEAHVFDTNSGRFGRYQAIPNWEMPETTEPRIRRFQWTTAGEAGKAYDREVIRLGLYDTKELNYPLTDYLPELQASRRFQRELDILYAWLRYKGPCETN